MADIYEKGLNYALYLLSLQMRTVYELRNKMTDKQYEPEIIDRVIAYLKEVNFVDDVSYAQQYIRSRRAKYGDYRIKMDLKRKGVSQGDVHLAYLGLEEEEDTLEPIDAVKVVLDKKIATLQIDWERLKSDYKYKYGLYQKLASFLANRGFSGGVIKEAIGERLSEQFIDEE